MAWSQSQIARLEQERAILKHYFPNLAWYHPTEPAKAYLEGPFATNSGRAFRLRIHLASAFPSVCPDMVVASPTPLRDARRNVMNEASASMHILGVRDGATKICHFRPSRWVPQNTLYLVALKGRIWLEAYDAHLRTGLPLDHYLRHMGENAGQIGAGNAAVDEEESRFLRLARRMWS